MPPVEGLPGLLERLTAILPDTILVLQTTGPMPIWRSIVDVAAALGTAAAALAAFVALWYARAERKRAERAEAALAQETDNRKRQVAAQVSAKAFALGAVIDDWLGRSPWDGAEVRPGIEMPAFDRWAEEFLARRPHMDSLAVSLMSWVHELPPGGQAALNKAYVTYHVASSAAANAAEGNLPPGDKIIGMIFADHAARLCREALKVLTASDLLSVVQDFVDTVGTDQLSRRRGELLKLHWKVHGPSK